MLDERRIREIQLLFPAQLGRLFVGHKQRPEKRSRDPWAAAASQVIGKIAPHQSDLVDRCGNWYGSRPRRTLLHSDGPR